jgi:hypothetical protein
LFEETFIKNRRRKSFEEQREIVEQSTKNVGNNNDLSTGKGVTFFKRKKKTNLKKTQNEFGLKSGLMRVYNEVT